LSVFDGIADELISFSLHYYASAVLAVCDVCLCVSVCLSQAGVLLRWLDCHRQTKLTILVMATGQFITPSVHFYLQPSAHHTGPLQQPILV